MSAVILAWREFRTLTMFDPIRGVTGANPTRREFSAD